MSAANGSRGAHDALILASASATRRDMLVRAGITVTAVPADLDEAAMIDSLRAAPDPLPAEDVAAVLAEAKAMHVSQANPSTLVIGCDQTLSLGNRLFQKPADMEEARRNLLTLAGKTHCLHSAVALVRDGETIWRHTATASLTMRDLHWPLPGCRRQRRARQRRLLSAGGSRRAALCLDRRRLFHHPGPAAAATARRAAR